MIAIPSSFFSYVWLGGGGIVRSCSRSEVRRCEGVVKRGCAFERNVGEFFKATRYENSCSVRLKGGREKGNGSGAVHAGPQLFIVRPAQGVHNCRKYDGSRHHVANLKTRYVGIVCQLILYIQGESVATRRIKEVEECESQSDSLESPLIGDESAIFRLIYRNTAINTIPADHGVSYMELLYGLLIDRVGYKLKYYIKCICSTT